MKINKASIVSNNEQSASAISKKYTKINDFNLKSLEKISNIDSIVI